MKHLAVNKRKLAFSIFLASAFSTSAFSADHNFNISQQSLDSALQTFAEQSGLQMVFVSKVSKGMQAQTITGRYDEGQALAMLLSGSGLGYEFIDERTVAIKPLDNAESDGAKGNKKSVLERGDREIEEMVVTSQLQEQNIKDVPISIVAIGAQELEQRRITDFNDLGMSVPGLNVMDNGFYGQRRIFLRGLGNIIGDPLVGVYVDEAPTTTMGQGLTLDYRTYDLDRIEVLKGPQGTLFGSGSIGGVVRFITKKPDLEGGFGGATDVSVSFTQDGAPSEDVMGVVNIPLVQDHLALRVSGVFENKGGWVDQPTAGEKDINDSSAVSVRTKLLWRPGDNLEVLGTYTVFRKDTGLAGTDGRGNIRNNEFVQAFGRLNTPSTRQDYDQYNLTIDYDLGSVHMLSSTSYVDIDNEYSNSPNDRWDVGWYWFQRQSAYEGDAFTQEIRFSSTEDGPFQWNLGAVYNELNNGSLYVSEYGPYDGPIAGEWISAEQLVKDVHSKSKAVFGQASYQISDVLEVGAGLRYFKDHRERDGLGEGDFDALSPRVFVRYDMTDEVNIFASISEGFRSGGINSAAAASAGFPDYDSETTRSYELGSKGYLFDGRIDYDISVFYSEMDGYQVISLLPGTPYNAPVNGGEAESKGIDWNIGWHITDRFTLGAHGTSADPRLVGADFDGQPINVGDRLPVVPKYHFGFTADYDFFLAGKSGRLNLEYNRKGQVLWHIRQGYYEAISNQSDIIEILNANISWDWSENITLGLFARNLLNENGMPNPFNDNTEWVNLDTGTPGALPPRPRTFGVSVGVEF